MPELPEVEVTRRSIEKTLVGRAIARVTTTGPSYFFLTPPARLEKAQRQAEQALRAERTFTGAVLQTAPVLILVLDKRGRILRANGFCGVVTGYAEAELTGRRWYDLLSPGPDQDAGRLMLEHAEAGRMESSRVLPLRTRDGQSRIISWDARALDLPIEIADQERAIALIGTLGSPDLSRWAEVHADIIRRFGRFPHRNLTLGRASTPEEQEFLDAGGFAG